MPITIGVLLILIVFNFYGLYTNRFYFLKIDNYIFPLLSIVHLTYLTIMQQKIADGEFADTRLRNFEYAMYAILLVYVFKVLDTIYILMSYGNYSAYIMPETFVPLGLSILALQFFLVFLTLHTFALRKQLLGKYNFDQINDNLDSW